MFSPFLWCRIIIRVFCPRVVPSQQAQDPRLQFCRRQVFHLKLRYRSCSFTRDWIGAVAFRCFPYPTLFRIWRDLKRSEKIPGATVWRWGEWIRLTGPSIFHRHSPQGLNISSMFLTRSEIRKSQLLGPLVMINKVNLCKLQFNSTALAIFNTVKLREFCRSIIWLRK